MSGVAGRFFTGVAVSSDAERTGLANSFAGPNRAPRSYADIDIELFVASRFDTPTLLSVARSFAEIVQSDRHVLAIEGYVLNVSDLGGAGPHAGRARGDIILELFERHGPSLFERLRGGYNVIVWSKADRVATVNSCRLGQRNLYSIATGDGFTFASDLQALRRISGRAFELDRETACMSFLYGGVYGQATPLRNVKKVLPGSTLTLRRGSVTASLACDLPRMHDSPVRRKKAFYVARLDALMRQAVARLGRVADTHAVMLGSGVDSSLVAAYAKGEIERVVALTQRMPGDVDESREAARIASALGLSQTIVPYDPKSGDLVAEVAAFVRVAEEPAYWNQLGPPLLHLLGSLERQPDSFLTGAEGDFLFHFRSARRASAARVIEDGLFWPVAGYTARRLVNRITRHTYIVGSDFDLLDRRYMRQHVSVDCGPYAKQTGYFDPSYPHLDAGPNAQRHLINNGWQNVRIISQFGCDAGSEVLFPYLDDDVVSYVLALPDELKINKVLLRIVLSRFLPRSIVPRTKRGYWAHTIKWHYDLDRLQGSLDVLSDRKTLDRGVYHAPAVRALIDMYARRTAPPRAHPVLWQLLVFEMFCRQFVDGEESRS